MNVDRPLWNRFSLISFVRLIQVRCDKQALWNGPLERSKEELCCFCVCQQLFRQRDMLLLAPEDKTVSISTVVSHTVTPKVGGGGLYHSTMYIDFMT